MLQADEVDQSSDVVVDGRDGEGKVHRERHFVPCSANRGEPAGRAELLTKKGNIWAHAASAGTGTDP